MGDAREIYLESCQQIAALLEPDGFRWRKSKTELVKDAGQYQFRIWFQSSSRNFMHRHSPVAWVWRVLDEAAAVAGVGRRSGAELNQPLASVLSELHRFGSVSLLSHVALESKEYGRWRGVCGLNPNGIVASTNLGYLMPQKRWLEINLARRSTRGARATATAEAIRRQAFPFLDRLSNRATAIESMCQEDVPGMVGAGAVEFAMFLAGREIARRVLDRELGKPGRAAGYREAVEEYRRQGIPEVTPARIGPWLARTAMVLGLEDVHG